MKDISLPPDAVHCECSLLATRSPRIKMATGVTAASHRHPRPRSLSRFLETIVRKVFDSQRKAKDTNWAARRAQKQPRRVLEVAPIPVRLCSDDP
ncbi:unnamed protein product [Heligmosomoides polygyrus]|uniref:Uncharacterized protein n=1 Tax=Heligmosomoides polygyrus TaxID=6339 RepID=A0A183FIZ9_HELPZ|nr:unnamed protein product [Heligmosomoides polygyrus]